jgi:hypothetical protein
MARLSRQKPFNISREVEEVKPVMVSTCQFFRVAARREFRPSEMGDFE